MNEFSTTSSSRRACTRSECRTARSALPTDAVRSRPSASRSRTATELVKGFEDRSVEVAEDLFVYRRFGNARTDVPPLLCLQHFRGNLDNWDPALVDRLVQDREVILLDNRGVGASTGVVPDNVTDMTRDVLRFIDELELEQVDVLGFSLGAYIAQELALLRPRLLRRIVLADTASQGAPNIHPWTDDVYALATPDEPSPDRFTKVGSTSSAFRRDRSIATSPPISPPATLS